MKKAFKWFEVETSRSIFRIGKNILTVSGKRIEWSAWSLQPLDFSTVFFKTENSKEVIAARQLRRYSISTSSLLFRRSNFPVIIIKRVYFLLKYHLARAVLCLSPSYSTFPFKVLTKLLPPPLSLILVSLGLTLPSLFVTICCLNQSLCLISPCCQHCFFVCLGFIFCYAIIYKILSLLWFDYHKHACFFSPWGHWANMSICMR